MLYRKLADDADRERIKNASDKARRTRTFAYLWLLLGMLALMVTFSFAWFSISSNPYVNDMSIYVNAPPGLELSLDYAADDEGWGQNIVYADLVTESTPLKPVTWSDAEQCFKAIRYGRDGRMLGNWKTLTDEENANRTGSKQYYVYGVFYARTGTKCKVSLAEAVELNEGVNGAGTYVIGKPEWNAAVGAHTDAGHGTEYAIRIGFRVAKIDPNTGAEIEEPEFYIYEPNADKHIDGSVQFIDTKSIDGTDTLVNKTYLIQQSSSTWAEAEPAQRDVTVKTLGEFANNVVLFEVNPGEMFRLNMYIWIEGQDVDCYGLPDESELAANIQFHTDYSGQSGMDDIPE